MFAYTNVAASCFCYSLIFVHHPLSLRKCWWLLHFIRVIWTSVTGAPITKQFFHPCNAIVLYSTSSVFVMCVRYKVSECKSCATGKANGFWKPAAWSKYENLCKVRAISTVDIHRKLLFYCYCCYFWTHFERFSCA